MSNPIFDPAYWSERLQAAQARGKLWQSVYEIIGDIWEQIEQRHAAVLAREIGPHDLVLDAGCGYGRLLDLMPATWQGDYVGVDLCETFIDLARTRKDKKFLVADLRALPFPDGSFDVAVLVSIKAMVLREGGTEAWDKIESELRRVARRLLVLEYGDDA